MRRRSVETGAPNSPGTAASRTALRGVGSPALRSRVAFFGTIAGPPSRTKPYLVWLRRGADFFRSVLGFVVSPEPAKLAEILFRRFVVGQVEPEHGIV